MKSNPNIRINIEPYMEFNPHYFEQEEMFCFTIMEKHYKQVNKHIFVFDPFQKGMDVVLVNMMDGFYLKYMLN